ncbi:MAG: DUF3179 domain-containing protein [Actinomycetota bacterium]|nr:DUF3179 domain-containing protein [Actinomycetota bacterium]
MSRRRMLTATLAASLSPFARKDISVVVAQNDVDDDLNVSTAGWKTDFSKHSVPLSEFRSGGPPRDGIPPIDEPSYVSQAEADTWLAPEEPVIAVALEGEKGEIVARAYPLQILLWHEIVNDTLGETPVAVTFCPLCYTAVAYDRRLEPGGTVYDFGTTGNLRHSDLVMWDRQTESWWQQFSGDALVGELTGSHLTFLPAQIMSWTAFKNAYPDGDVLSRETGFDRPYGTNPYPGYDDIDSRPFLFNGSTDERLPPMERVVGIVTENEGVAYPFPDLQHLRLIEDRIGDAQIVVFWAPGASSAVDTGDVVEGRDIGQAGVFSRNLDGRVLSFSPGSDDSFTDVETGSTWDVTGLASAGDLAGEYLAPIPHTVVFWFAWAAFQPEGRFWQPPG